MSGARITLALILIVQLSNRVCADLDCCDNVRCGSPQCGANRTLILANPAKCICCDQCSLLRDESCIPGYGHDKCGEGLTCYATDETGERGICEPVHPTSEYPEGEDDYQDNTATDDAEVEMCDVEECESILRCPLDGRLVLDQSTPAEVSQSFIDQADCCKRRFAPKCICDYHKCPTTTSVAVKHCLQNPNVTLSQSETCCALIERCVRVATGARKSSAPVSASPPAYDAHQVCSPWLNRSRLAYSIDKNDWTVEQCTPRTRTLCHNWYEASLRASNEITPTCCADLKCASQRNIVCEAARCPQELGFVAALLTNLETCVCVKATSNGQMNICPQRLCAARSGKCYHHTHILDDGGCPVCVSNEVPCNRSDETAASRRVCDDYRTGRHNVGERWFSESCGNCLCSQDGITRCEVDCTQNNREWVSVNITLVLACTALAISLLVLIYIVGRKLRSKNWKTRKQTLSRAQLMKASIHGSLSGGFRNGDSSWRALNGHIPPTSLSDYMMERSRYSGENSVWQPATDLSTDDFVYVALNGNTESFQKASCTNHTATTTLESNATNVTSSTIV